MLLPTHVRGTMTLLPSGWRHLSPAVGLALSSGGSQLVSRLYEQGLADLGKGSGSAPCSLATELFHRNHHAEPLHPTSNRSLPAAHLSASLCAHVGAIASGGLTGTAARAALVRATCSQTGLTLPKLASATGVSIARFERLVDLVRVADEESSPAATAGVFGECVPNAGSTLLMRHLWLRSSPYGKGLLWEYMRTLRALIHEHCCTAAAPGASEDEVEAHFLRSTFSRDELVSPTAAGEAAIRLFACRAQPVTVACGAASESAELGEAMPPCNGHVTAELGEEARQAEAFEFVCAAMANGAEQPTPLLQGRFGYNGQPPVADCAEACVRELLNVLLWSPERGAFDAAKLPSSAMAGLRGFYEACPISASSGPATQRGAVT